MKSPSPNRCDYSTVLAIQSLSELLLLLKRRIESTRPATYQFSLLLTAWRRRNCHRPLWRRQGAEAPLLAEGSGHSVSAAALVVRFSDGGSLHHCRSWSSPTSAVSSSRAGVEASRTPRWLVLHGDERERAVVEARHAGVGAGLTQVPAGAPHANGPPLAGAMVLYNWREKAEGRL